MVSLFERPLDPTQRLGKPSGKVQKGARAGIAIDGSERRLRVESGSPSMITRMAAIRGNPAIPLARNLRENLGLVDFHVVSAGVSLGDAQGCCR